MTTHIYLVHAVFIDGDVFDLIFLHLVFLKIFPDIDIQMFLFAEHCVYIGVN